MIVLAQYRKEERKIRKVRLGLQQTVTQDETVLALQRKLEEKQQERQRLKQSESKKAKTPEQTAAYTVRKTETHNRVSLKSKAKTFLSHSVFLLFLTCRLSVSCSARKARRRKAGRNWS